MGVLELIASTLSQALPMCYSLGDAPYAGLGQAPRALASRFCSARRRLLHVDIAYGFSVMFLKRM